MTTAKDFRSWLIMAPRPTVARLQLADGQVHEVECNQPWARLGETCAAMDAVKVWAIDGHGKVLRVANVADIADDLEPEDTPARSSAEATATAAALQKDDSRAMLAVLDKFGSLLADAYKHATATAFEKMVEVVQLQSQAVTAMQRELVAARVEVRHYERDLVDDALERAEAAGDGDMFRQFVGAYMSGQAEHLATKATNAVVGAKPNGKPAPQPPPANKGPQS